VNSLRQRFRSGESGKAQTHHRYDGSTTPAGRCRKPAWGAAKDRGSFQEAFPSVRRIHSSSRTDTGVHALGMVAHVEIHQMPLPKWPRSERSAENSDSVCARATQNFMRRSHASGSRLRFSTAPHPQCVDTGVGPAGAVNAPNRREKLLESFLDLLLHPQAGFLHLQPA